MPAFAPVLRPRAGAAADDAEDTVILVASVFVDNVLLLVVDVAAVVGVLGADTNENVLALRMNNASVEGFAGSITNRLTPEVQPLFEVSQQNSAGLFVTLKQEIRVAPLS